MDNSNNNKNGRTEAYRALGSRLKRQAARWITYSLPPLSPFAGLLSESNKNKTGKRGSSWLLEGKPVVINQLATAGRPRNDNFCFLFHIRQVCLFFRLCAILVAWMRQLICFDSSDLPFHFSKLNNKPKFITDDLDQTRKDT